MLLSVGFLARASLRCLSFGSLRFSASSAGRMRRGLSGVGCQAFVDRLVVLVSDLGGALIPRILLLRSEESVDTIANVLFLRPVPQGCLLGGSIELIQRRENVDF